MVDYIGGGISLRESAEISENSESAAGRVQEAWNRAREARAGPEEGEFGKRENEIGPPPDTQEKHKDNGAENCRPI